MKTEKDWTQTSFIHFFSNWDVAQRSDILDRYVKNYPVRKQVRLAHEMGADVFTIDVQSHHFGWYENSFNPKHPALGEREPIREMVEECRKLKMKSIGYFATPAFYHVIDEHPEWLQKAPENNECIVCNEVRHFLCLNTPYLDYLNGEIKNVLKKYPLDGIFFDGLISFYDPWCQCDSCRELFHREAGFDLPDHPLRLSENPTSEQLTYIKAFKDWTYSQFEKWELALQDACHDAREDTKAHFNIGFAWVKGPDVTLCKKLDMACCEQMATNDREIRLTSYQMLRFREQTHPGIATTYACLHDAALKVPFRLLSAVARNIALEIDSGKLRMVDLKPVVTHIRKLEPYLRHRENIAEVALLHSRLTCDFSEIAGNEQTYWDYNSEIANLLKEKKYPYTIIEDNDLADLSHEKYKLLILNNSELMSDKSIDGISRFVDGGGNLIITNRTSLRNENGCMRKDFGLSKLMQASFVDELEKISSNPSLLKEEYIRKEGMGTVELVKGNAEEIFSKDFLSYIKSPDLLGHHYYSGDFVFRGDMTEVKCLEQGTSLAFWNHLSGASPAVIESCFGRGKVLYIAGDIGQALFMKHGETALKNLMFSFLKYLYPKPVIEIQGPNGMEANYYFQGENKLMIHLIQCFDDQDVKADNIKIRLNGMQNARIEKIFGYPEKNSHDIKNGKDATEITVSNVGTHCLVVCRL